MLLVSLDVAVAELHARAALGRALVVPLAPLRDDAVDCAILRVARTLADLDHRDMPGAENVATAIRWRDIAF